MERRKWSDSQGLVFVAMAPRLASERSWECRAPRSWSASTPIRGQEREALGHQSQHAKAIAIEPRQADVQHDHLGPEFFRLDQCRGPLTNAANLVPAYGVGSRSSQDLPQSLGRQWTGRASEGSVGSAKRFLPPPCCVTLHA